jgi:O-antigen ligase
MTAARLRLLGPVGLALAVAAAWPLTAYTLNPLVFPALLALAAGGAIVLRRPDVGLAAVLVLAPFTNAEVGGGRPVRFVVSGLAFALLAYGLLVEARGRARPGGVLAGAILAFVAVAALTSLHAIDPAKSLTRFLGVLVAAAMFLAVLQICRGRRELEVVAYGALASLLVTGVQGVIQKVTGHTSFAGVIIDDEVVGRVAGSFSHPNQYAGYLIVLIPVVIALGASRSTPQRIRYAAAAAAGLALAALALSYTRGAILGLVGGALIWLAFVRPRTAAAVLVIVVVAGGVVAPSSLKERLSDPAGSDLGLRADLWGSALEIFRGSPVLGVGLADFSDGYSQLPAQLSTGAQRRLLHQQQVLVPPHANNLFLTILAEQGIIGALAFLGLIGAALSACRRAARLDDPFGRAIGIGLGAGLGAMLVHSLLEFQFFGEVSLPIFALLGVVAAVLADAPAASARRVGDGSRALAAAHEPE